MGFWGKAIGAGLGFMVGGPLGAIIGGAIGHSFDADSGNGKKQQVQCPHCGNKVIIDHPGNWSCPYCGKQIGYSDVGSDHDRQFVFYVSLASLAAKMAKADGVVTDDEVKAFDHFVRADLGLKDEERKIVARLFNEAKKSPEDGLSFARQFKSLIGYQPDVAQMMIQLLFRISMADGHFHPAEEQFIRQVSSVLGISQMEYDQIMAIYVKNNDGAYRILGVTPQATDDEIKKSYRKLVVEYHPDKLMAKGIPEDFIKIANEKMAEINNAYNALRKERGF